MKKYIKILIFVFLGSKVIDKFYFFLYIFCILKVIIIKKWDYCIWFFIKYNNKGRNY